MDGLGFIPGLCCPHHDRIQSNGILRATDFDTMLLRHPTEVSMLDSNMLHVHIRCDMSELSHLYHTKVGICIDHNAAFVIDNANYSVKYPEGLEGSVLADGTFSEERLGKPCVWIKEVSDDEQSVIRTLCPENGKLSDLLKVSEEIFHSVRHMKLAAMYNPDDGPMRLSYPGFMAKSFFGGNVSKKFLDIMKEASNENDDDEK